MSSPEERPAPPRRRRKARGGLLGLGLDARDGHQRITKGDDFLLLGGSQETHERMTDIVMRMREGMKRRGKAWEELTRTEFEDLGREALE